MKEFRLRPKKDYLHTATWEDIYALSEHWLTDLEFFKDELNFLDILIGKYFLMMLKNESVDKIHNITSKISGLIKEQQVLTEKINKHLKDLSLLMENAFNTSEQWFRNDHVDLEERLTLFTDNFRNIKKEIFMITEYVIENQKLKHLLNA
ncbi:MAG: hypothetical protein SFY56_10900 [Bacteroidota bacterium]|nr:hypothetical protein [Bacteroidota bacterium]